MTDCMDRQPVIRSAFAAAKSQAAGIDASPVPESTEDIDSRNAAAVSDLADSDEGLPANVVGDLDVTEEEPSIVVQLSSWTPGVQHRWPEVELVAGAYLTCVGQYDLYVNSGAVSIYGARIVANAARQTIFAPSFDALPKILCLTKTARIEIRSSHGPLSRLRHLSPLFERIWNAESALDPDDRHAPTFQFLRKSTDDELRRSLYPQEPPTDYVLESLSQPSHRRGRRVVICGPKGAGKSTFARCLVNHIVTSGAQAALSAGGSNPRPIDHRNCCYLDLDPGQPEMTPAGLVSLTQIKSPLLGPPMSHPFPNLAAGTRLLKAHAIASSSPRDDPEHYLACVKDLFTFYNTAHSEETLVVNCPGWVLGLGLELTTAVIRLCHATDIVYLSDGSLEKSAAVVRAAAGSGSFHNFTSARVPSLTRTAPQLRAMHQMSYFHYRTSRGQSAYWDPSPILPTSSASRNLMRLKYRGPVPDILGIKSIGEEPREEFLPTVLDQNIVALVVIDESDLATKLSDGTSAAAPSGLPFWSNNDRGYDSAFDPNATKCIGLGIVGAIDADNASLTLVTPEADSIQGFSKSSNEGVPRLVLLRGPFDVPGWAYIEAYYFENSRARGSAAAAIETTGHALRPVPASTYDEAASGDELMPPYVRRLEAGEAAGAKWRGVKGRS